MPQNKYQFYEDPEEEYWSKDGFQQYKKILISAWVLG